LTVFSVEHLHRLPEEIALPARSLIRAMVAMEVVEERRKAKREAEGHGYRH
jgi:hypothetical protein